MLRLLILTIFLFEYGRSQQIRQCTCQEMEQCKGIVHQNMAPCFQKCQSKSSINVNFESLHQCMQQERQRSNGGCFSSFRNQMCASSPNQMIDISETFQGAMNSNSGGSGSFGGRGFFGQMFQNRLGSGGGDDGQSGGGPFSGGGGFFRRMWQNRMGGGENGQGGQGGGSEFRQCIHSCMENSPNRGKGAMCFMSLGCGVKRPQPGMFMQMMQQCSGEREARHQRICQCLTFAGASEMCNQMQNGGGFGGRGMGFFG